MLAAVKEQPRLDRTGSRSGLSGNKRREIRVSASDQRYVCPSFSSIVYGLGHFFFSSVASGFSHGGRLRFGHRWTWLPKLAGLNWSQYPRPS